VSSTFSPVNNPPEQELIDSMTVSNPVDNKSIGRARFTIGWQSWFSDAFNFLQALTSSGTTANRPTKFIWTGRTYYDTTLNKPIWVKNMTGATVNWVDATGTGV
jgi:hypothetical protein